MAFPPPTKGFSTKPHMLAAYACGQIAEPLWHSLRESDAHTDMLGAASRGPHTLSLGAGQDARA
eukprot:410948-Rhodomonas_salina.1